MKLKSLYESLLNEKKQTQNPLSNEVFDRLVKELDQPGKWFEAMAVCEAALDVGLVNDNVQKLRREMFVNGKELHSGATLNETDYIDWFAQVVDFNKKLIDAGIDEAWVELGSIYLNARYPFRDIKKAEQYMLEGVKLNDPLALAYYGYHHYFGIGNISVNKEEGKKMMLKAQELGFAKAIAYLLTTKFDTDTDLPTYEKEILQYSASVKPADQLWHLLGNVYRDKEQNLSKALEAYEKGIELADDPYCKYQKAVLILTEKTEGDFDEALAMMKDASEWNIIYAMSFLGQFYCFNEQYLNIEKAIEWYKKAISYCDVSAMVNLALVYLYNEDYQDIDKGLMYLDRAIEQNELRAMNEKAHFLLENSERNEINQAKILLEKACEMGDEYAPFRLGVGYQNAEFQETYEYKKAYEYYILAAERNNLHAIELLGRYCRMGLTGEANPEKTIEYFQRAIDMDSNYARVELAICYEDGFGVEQDSHKAFELLKKAADNDYPYAHSKLGGYYMNGVATEKNLDLAFEHFSRAADSGEPDAMYNLGRIYKYAIGKPENPEQAINYFKKAADNGNENASIEMALSYEYEYGGLEFDADKILEYIVPPAENGHPDALYKLGCYYCFNLIGDDKEKGLDYFRRAYDCGSAYAALSLGDHFLYNSEPDYSEAFKYYQQAAEQNCISEGIGLCLLIGLGVERNETEAFKYFSIAASRGYIAAKYRAGMCCKYGTGTELNRSEAFRWLREAAEQGHADSEYEIGMFFLNGMGVSENPVEGVEWLRRAADQEHDRAQYELGNCYLMGQGVDEDEEWAMFWYKRASENGNDEAKKITKIQ